MEVPSGPRKLVPSSWNPAHTASTGAPRSTARPSAPEAASWRAAAVCGPVLAPADDVDVAVVGDGVAGADVDDLGLDAAPPGALGEHHGVAVVAVGAEQVGEEPDDAQRSVERHRRPSSTSANTV